MTPSENAINQKNIVIGIYFHPENYPPTLNAVAELSECFKLVTIIHRPHLKGKWKFPANVKAVPSGRFITSLNQEKASLIKKVGFFLQFTTSLFRACRREKPGVVLIYDSLSLLAYRLIRPFLHSHKIWYHNHDVTENNALRKYSIGWFAARHERRAFTYLDIFSLPANERLKYFPMDAFKGRYFYIPNYPSKKVYVQFYHPLKLDKTIKIIYQGQVTESRGIEQTIPLLKEKISGLQLELIINGPCAETYRNVLQQIAREYGVMDKMSFGLIPYSEVPKANSQCHIGLGILAQKNVMHDTIGTATNKLYEYAAIGLPVIYYNNEASNKYLNQRSWAFPADLDTSSVKSAIMAIVSSYEELSKSAHNDFLNELNYEKAFEKVKNYVGS